MITKAIFHTIICFILSCSLAFVIIGCGGGAPKAPEGKQVAANNVEKITQAPDKTSQSSKQAKVDPKKGKMLGDIPYDVWFDDPIGVSGDNKQVAVTTTATPGPSKTTPGMKPEPTPEPKPKPDSTANATIDWKKVIPAEVLNDEVKSIRNRFSGKLRNVGTYNRSYLEFAPFCITLSVLAEVASEHPGDLRWKKNAKIVRDLSALMIAEKLRTGAKSFKQVQIPFEQLTATLDGSPPSEVKKPSDEDSFADVADMGGVMKRMEMLAKFLKDNSGSEDVFTKYKDDLRHRAYILAAMTKALNTEGYGYSDDEVFLKFSNTMVEACIKMAEAAEAEDYKTFDKTLPIINQNCTECHSEYRT